MVSNQYKTALIALITKQVEEYLVQAEEHEDEVGTMTVENRAKDFILYQAEVNG